MSPIQKSVFTHYLPFSVLLLSIFFFFLQMANKLILSVFLIAAVAVCAEGYGKFADINK